MRRDFINAGILWFVLTLAAELLLPVLFGMFPLAASEEAAVSDESFRLLMILGTPVFTFVVAVLIYSVINFRARDGALENGAPIRSNDRVAGLWLLVTGGLCVTVIVHPGLTGLAKFQGDRNADVVVKVTGRQWTWDLSYPEYNITGATEVVLPVNKRVKFEITSTDVLHSFWIPAFRNKMDAVPGLVTTMFVTPDKVASFAEDYNLRVQCTEICGLRHAAMSVPVRVVTLSEFEKWTQEKSILADNPVARGETLARSQACMACHSTDGSTLVGPTWRNLYGSPVVFEDGTTQTADEAFLLQFITDPDFKIIKGFPKGVMPQSFGKTLTADQLDDLIAYIKTLGPD
ncbi:MAG: cytochrome c oxidase subunit II [Chloroflexi bacterium]|nr:cytochrome c oxidase subunit II [Chloroflexota bacterium]